MGDQQRQAFITLEGLSGVGKSTIAQILGTTLKGAVYKTPSKPFQQIQKDIETLACPNARYLFYLANIYAISQEIDVVLRATPVICDRYLHSTICAHRARHVEMAAFPTPGLRMPDLAILLVCDKVERINRVQQRGWSFIDQNEHYLDERIADEYTKMDDLMVIDTTSRSVASIVDFILTHYHQLRIP